MKLLRLICISFLWINIACMGATTPLATPQPMQQPTKKKRSKGRKKYISFNFDNEDLTTIINYIAAEKKINIILPAPPHNITSKISLRIKDKLTVDEAYSVLNTVLDVAGYSIQQHGNTALVVKNDANSMREALPAYIGIEPQNLPDTDERIRYLYYFDNIKIPPGGAGQAQEIKTILEDMVLDPTKPGTSQVLFDSNTNSVIVTGKSYAIKIAMQVISELDKTGFREVVEVINLLNTDASFVSRFLMEQLIFPTTTEKSGPGFVVGPPGSDTSYFSKTLKVIPNSRTNSLIILGRTQAVERLKDFIYKYIDIPLESGESIIHVYELQYLDAQSFAPVLEQIIKTPEAGGQSKGSSPESRAFEGVIIESEKVTGGEALKTKIGEVGEVTRGGNRLIIAARKNEWANLKTLIQDLDKPQPQVALEVLVVDVTLASESDLGSQMRNKRGLLPNDVNFQAANLSNPVLPTDPSTGAEIPTTLATDLLQLVVPTIGQAGTNSNNLANQAFPGTFVLSFNDPSIATPGIWWVMELLKQNTSSKILSHPSVITLNHVQSKISISTNRIVQGAAKQNPDGTLTVQNVEIKGDLQVEILPRINLSNSINLQIAVNVNNFTTNNLANNTRDTRKVITNATVGNGEILVIGGLVQTRQEEEAFDTPLLGKIPFLGWLFKGRSSTLTKNNLMIFISPTVIKPKIGGGMNDSTKMKFDLTKGMTEDAELFGQIQDPITRWFFAQPEEGGKALTYHYEQGDFFSDQPLKGGEKTVEKPKESKAVTRLDEQKAAAQLKQKLNNESNPVKNLRVQQ